MRNTLLVSLLLFVGLQASSKVLISTVAQVKNHVITSREVEINKTISRYLGNHLEGLSREDDTEYVIKIWLLYLEASGFYTTPLPPTQIQARLSDLEKKVNQSKAWKELQVTEQELKEIMTRRLEAERIYLFKRKASVLPVSPSEIDGEFRQNRVRYEGKTLDEVREEIRQMKTMDNLSQRMQQWFVVLESKYKVQRFSKLVESE